MKYRIVGLALALIAAAAGCSGGQQNSSSSTTTQTQASAEPTVGAMTNAAKAPANGASVYNANCSSCHQATGKGVAGQFPPLAGNVVVTGDATKVIHIVKDGLQGTIHVNGQTYNGVMPVWKTQLKNADIAAVVTYIRSSWGNHASAVNEKQVAAVK